MGHLRARVNAMQLQPRARVVIPNATAEDPSMSAAEQGLWIVTKGRDSPVRLAGFDSFVYVREKYCSLIHINRGLVDQPAPAEGPPGRAPKFKKGRIRRHMPLGCRQGLSVAAWPRWRFSGVVGQWSGVNCDDPGPSPLSFFGPAKNMHHRITPSPAGSTRLSMATDAAKIMRQAGRSHKTGRSTCNLHLAGNAHTYVRNLGAWLWAIGHPLVWFYLLDGSTG